jgi:hypothetical protein
MVRRVSWRLLSSLAFSVITACSPTLPPTTVPPQPDPAFEPFRTALQRYVDQTQPVRKDAAVQAERVPDKAAAESGAEQSLRARQSALAEALRTKIRPGAERGNLVSPEVGAAVVRQIETVFRSPKRELLMDELAEQNDTPARSATPKINQPLEAPRVPPRLIEVLPPLPKQLEYDFVGRTLVIRDVDADVVVDFVPNALPLQPAPGPSRGAPSPAPARAAGPLALPEIRGGVVFAVIGDSGSGNNTQRAVARSMLRYFTEARRFSFVLMLGDNLYGDDYVNEFSLPYKELLERGVRFHASLGNHDRDTEIHYKPFNMGDVDRYWFDEGNARFAALNSNHPSDPMQLAWIDQAFADAGTKWRIAFFHHPPYSSGQHSAEGRDVIRPAFEPALLRNHVNVVFSGHEHLYERIKPQRNIQYFVSGGGGRYLHRFRPGAYDEVGASAHHFMVVEVAGDRMFFEAVTDDQALIDCGVTYRTPEAAAKKADDAGAKWLEECQSARPPHKDSRSGALAERTRRR